MVTKPVEVLTKQEKARIREKKEREKQRLDRIVEKKFALACQSTKLHNIKAARQLVHSLPVAAFDRALDINEESTRRDFLAYLIRYVFMSIEPNTDRYKNFVPDLKRLKRKLEDLQHQRKQERKMKKNSKENGHPMPAPKKPNEFMKINDYCPSHRQSPKKRIFGSGPPAAASLQ